MTWVYSVTMFVLSAFLTAVSLLFLVIPEKVNRPVEKNFFYGNVRRIELNIAAFLWIFWVGTNGVVYQAEPTQYGLILLVPSVFSAFVCAYQLLFSSEVALKMQRILRHARDNDHENTTRLAMIGLVLGIGALGMGVFNLLAFWGLL